ncbi:ABC transporter permease [Massilia sp. TWP1-3-3]|uniref:ABC transporter permease n=1 Tax=Massilia sp. TWP1-3-3 TaxID=2804573 RepID=UPI003CF41A99
MTAFIALVRKDLLLFFSDRRALLVNLVLPIVIATFFGYLFGGSGKSETSRIEVALVQLDADPVSAKIAAGLKGDASLAVSEMTLEQARKEVGKGRQKAAIVIPRGFGQAAGAALFGAGEKPAIALLYDPSQQAVLAMVKGMLTQQVMQVVSAEMFNGQAGQDFTGKSMAALDQRDDPDSVALREMLGSVNKYRQRPQAASGGAKGALSTPFSTSEEQVSSGSKLEGYNGYAHSFAGMGVQFILFLGIDIGIGVLLARRSGIFNRLLAAPVSLQTVLLARAASAAVIALFLLCTIFAFAVAVLGVRISNPVGFAGVAIAFSVLTASFGLFIAAFGKTPEAARGIAVFATLIMVMLGGAWVPSFMFPAWVQSAATVVPTKWAIDGFDAMTWRGQGMDAALMAIGVQLAFGAVFGLLALWKFKREQRG